jgi:tetratricopeptide (TPR) repeat protein
MRHTATALITAGLMLGMTAAAIAQQTPTPVPPAPTRAPTATPPTRAERIADRAIALLAGWKVKAAETLLTTNEQELGATPEFRTALGYLRAAQGKWDEATTLLRGAAADKPTDPAPQYYLGETMSWRQKPADADTAWKAARTRATAQVEARASDARAQYYLGAAKVRLKQYGQARTALEQARTLGFDPVLVDYQAGLSFTLEERWQQAVESFDKVLAKDAKFAHAYFFRGLAYGKLDRKDKMLVDMDLFVAYAPHAPEAAIARLYLQR